MFTLVDCTIESLQIWFSFKYLIMHILHNRKLDIYTIYQFENYGYGVFQKREVIRYGANSLSLLTCLVDVLRMTLICRMIE